MDKNTLIEIAKKHCKPRRKDHNISIGEVASALITSAGNIYTGVSIVVPCGMGFCAEHAAIAEMLKNNESEISLIVAVTENGVVPPCGRCREFIRQINPVNYNITHLILSDGIIPLKSLLPNPFSLY